MNISDVPDTMNNHHRQPATYASIAAVIAGCVLVMFAGPMLVVYAIGVGMCGIASVVWWEKGKDAAKDRAEDEEAAVLHASETLGFHMSRKNLARLREAWANDEAPFSIDVDVYDEVAKTLDVRQVILTAAGDLAWVEQSPDPDVPATPHTTQA